MDGDGDLDVVVTTTNGRAYVLRNDGGNAGNWLRLRFVGRKSNRRHRRRRAPRRGVRALQHATVTTTSSYLSASDRRVHFGLGAEKLVKSLEVRWPGGATQRLADVAVNKEVTITEP